MFDTTENASSQQDDAVEYGDDESDTPLPPADSVDDNEALLHGPTRSLSLSLLAFAMVLAFLGLRPLLAAENQQDSHTSIAWAMLMALSLLIAMPAWVVSTGYAIGSLVTMQRRGGLALLALLLNVASAIVFLLAK